MVEGELSGASVSWFGVVVSVIGEEPIIRKIRRAPTYGMRHTLTGDRNFQIRTSTSPGVK